MWSYRVTVEVPSGAKMAVGVSPPTFLHSFPPLGYACELPSSFVIQRKVVTRNRKDKAATTLPSAPGIPNQLGRTLGHTPSSKHIMDPRGQHASSRRTNSHNISRLDAGGALPGVRRPRSPTGWSSVPSPSDSPPVLVRCRALLPGRESSPSAASARPMPAGGRSSRAVTSSWSAAELARCTRCARSRSAGGAARRRKTRTSLHRSAYTAATVWRRGRCPRATPPRPRSRACARYSATKWPFSTSYGPGRPETRRASDRSLLSGASTCSANGGPTPTKPEPCAQGAPTVGTTIPVASGSPVLGRPDRQVLYPEGLHSWLSPQGPSRQWPCPATGCPPWGQAGRGVPLQKRII